MRVKKAAKVGRRINRERESGRGHAYMGINAAILDLAESPSSEWSDDSVNFLDNGIGVCL